MKSKQIWIIVAIVAVLFVIVGIWFYRKGKKTTTIQTVPKDNPDPNGVNNPAGISDSEITSLANNLHTDMNGFNLWGHDPIPYQKLDSLSDTDFVKTYNAFNTLYQNNGGTLRAWINGETFIFSDVIGSITNRMDRLNLI